MNLRQRLYFLLFRLRGIDFGAYYEQILQEYRNGIPADTSKRLLVQMLAHCQQHVPYYAEVMCQAGDSFRDDPVEYLREFPLLTKDIIRSRLDDLKSSDLSKRKWFYNTSGGSTGEPVRFIQDHEYSAWMGAVKNLYSKLAGYEIGDTYISLWGSERDIFHSSEELKSRILNKLSNSIYLNAYRMTPVRMREYIAVINARRPKLLVCYAESLYELARFVEREKINVHPQVAIMTSAGVLYPFMREKIEKVFQCRVYNRYGSREVGDIACEVPGLEGLWVAPWGTYVEIVDDDGNRVSDGTEGEIVVTSLTNFAMPLIRYRIGDRGVLAPLPKDNQKKYGQVLMSLLGKTNGIFKTRSGMIDCGYFEGLMYYRDWVRKFQVVQKNYSWVLFKIAKSNLDYQQAELDEIESKTRLVMGNDCKVTFEFVDEIAPLGSGKYCFTISEVEG
jgi:phenylacetate-CoA ligase